MSALLTPQQPADCWDWITAEDVVRHALAAYYAASRAVDKYLEGPWVDPDTGASWSSRADFRDDLWGYFRQRINTHAWESGVRASSGGEVLALPAGLLWDALDPVSGPEGSGEPGAGRSPAVEGHGCPALSSAVGPAPAARTKPAEAGGVPALHNLPADPLFAASGMQELPWDIGSTTNSNHRGAMSC